MHLETITITLPSKNTIPFEIGSTYIADRQAKFMTAGKMLRESMIGHPNGLVRVVARMYRDEAARLEWWNDPIVRARSVLAREHNDRNGITVKAVWADL